MDYGFKLNYSDLSEELLDEKFEEWKKYMEENDLQMFDKKSPEYEDEIGLRQMFEEDVQNHFPIYF